MEMLQKSNTTKLFL